MRLVYNLLFLAATLAAILPAFADEEEGGAFARYQVILDRMPFGDTRAAAAAAAAPANPNLPPLSASLKLVALEKDDQTGALQAGIVDGPGKKNHYLFVGQEEEGIKLVSADYVGERALVHKGDQEEWLVMGSGGGAKAPGPTANTPPTLEARRNLFREMQSRRSAAGGTPPPQPQPGNVIRDPNSPKNIRVPPLPGQAEEVVVPEAE